MTTTVVDAISEDSATPRMSSTKVLPEKALPKVVRRHASHPKAAL